MTGARLSQLADGATIAVAIAILVSVGSQFRPSGPAGMSESELVEFRAGDVLDLDGRTLLMVLRSDCRFCQQSMPFYRRLLERDSCSSGRAAGGGPGSQEGRMIWSALIRTIVSQAGSVCRNSGRSRGSGRQGRALTPRLCPLSTACSNG